jgi:ABC-type uncharacterized transport system ATPase subunit
VMVVVVVTHQFHSGLLALANPVIRLQQGESVRDRLEQFRVGLHP